MNRLFRPLFGIVSIWLVWSVTLSGARAAEPLTLAADGRTDYAIVIGENPTPVEQNAARELSEHLQQVTGAEWPVRSIKEVPEEARQIVVGDTPRTRQ